MKYEKPEVVRGVSAIDAIQEIGPIAKVTDNLDSEQNPSDPAYQADE